MSRRPPEPEGGAVTADQAAAGDSVDYGNNTEPPGDRFQAADGFGTTPAEVRAGEGLAGRLAREVPEDTGLRRDGDDEASGQSAEEAAMHEVPGS